MGAEAATLAAAGFTSCDCILEAPNGYSEALFQGKLAWEILTEGVKMLDVAESNNLLSGDVPDKDWYHKTRLDALKNYCADEDKVNKDNAGHLILDALTIHGKDSARIDRTITG